MESDQPTIAIVDDDRRVLESLRNLLESAGYQILLFDSGSALLADEASLTADCVVCDVHMRDVGGKELLQILQAKVPSLPIIMITGREGEESAASYIRLGARFFFRKPLKSRRLLDAIAACLT